MNIQSPAFLLPALRFPSMVSGPMVLILTVLYSIPQQWMHRETYPDVHYNDISFYWCQGRKKLSPRGTHLNRDLATFGDPEGLFALSTFV